MPLTDAQTQSLIRHLATDVMGWKMQSGKHDGFACGSDGASHSLWGGFSILAPRWNPTTDGSAMMQVWEAAREKDYTGSLINCYPSANGWVATVWDDTPLVVASARTDSGPLALCLAVGRATGWEEPTT